MLKGKDLIITICDKITKLGIYTAIFLVPIFFVPFTYEVLDFNKQTALAFLVFAALFAWMAKVLVSGTLEVAKSRVHIAVGVLLLAYLVSTLFSVTRYGSFWGWPQAASESLFSLICLAVLYFLVSGTFSQKEIRHSLVLLSLSGSIALTYGILQLSGWHFLPFNFARSNAFNTIGSIGAFGIFAALLLPLSLLFAIVSEKWWRIFFLVNTGLVFIALLLVRYPLVWWIALAGSLLVIAFAVIKRDAFDARWMFLPMFFFIVSLFFIIFSPYIRWLPQHSEVFLSVKANFGVNAKALKENPLFGSGPGTFSYDFNKHKDKDFNQDALWNINLAKGASSMLTSLATIGSIGFLAWFLLIGTSLFYGARYVLSSIAKKDSVLLAVALSVLLMAALQALSWALYNSNFVLDMAYFLSIGSLVALMQKDRTSYALKSSSWATLLAIFTFTTLYILGSGFLLLGSQRYLANIHYRQGLIAFAQGRGDDAILHAKRAASHNSTVDFYFAQLSLMSLARIQEQVSDSAREAEDGELDAEAKNRIQSLVADTVAAGNIATRLGSRKVDNWATRAYVCHNLGGLITDAYECAVQSYDQAISLSPANPYLLLQKGLVHLDFAALAEGDEKKQFLQDAESAFKKAVEMKQDYAPAYLQIAAVARLQADNAKEERALEDTQKYSQNNPEMLLQIGLAYYRSKQWEKAQVQFQRALVIVPNYANALYYAGLSYNQLSQTQKAIYAFSKLSELHPNNQDIGKILDNLKSGKPALDGLVPEPPSPNPSPKETPDAKLKKE